MEKKRTPEDAYEAERRREWNALRAYDALDELKDTGMVQDDILESVRDAIKKAEKGE